MGMELGETLPQENSSESIESVESRVKINAQEWIEKISGLKFGNELGLEELVKQPLDVHNAGTAIYLGVLEYDTGVTKKTASIKIETGEESGKIFNIYIEGKRINSPIEEADVNIYNREGLEEEVEYLETTWPGIRVNYVGDVVKDIRLEDNIKLLLNEYRSRLEFQTQRLSRRLFRYYRDTQTGTNTLTWYFTPTKERDYEDDPFGIFFETHKTPPVIIRIDFNDKKILSSKIVEGEEIPEKRSE